MQKKLLLIPLFLLLLAGECFAEYAAVIQDKANIRSGPGTNYDIIYTLESSKYYPLKILKEEGKWLQIQDYEGDIGWVANFLVDTKTDAVIVKEKANVRENPEKTAKKLWTAEQGETFKVLQKKELWLEVIDPVGNRGWIYKSLLWGIE